MSGLYSGQFWFYCQGTHAFMITAAGSETGIAPCRELERGLPCLSRASDWPKHSGFLWLDSICFIPPRESYINALSDFRTEHGRHVTLSMVDM